jgi:hypothetical protein
LQFLKKTGIALAPELDTAPVITTFSIIVFVEDARERLVLVRATTKLAILMAIAAPNPIPLPTILDAK